MTAAFNGSKKSKISIGVLGGSFDPVHLGHKALGEAAMREVGLSRLIVMPAGIQPFKQDQKVTDGIHREAMAKLAFKDNENVSVCSYEIRNSDKVSYTVMTLSYLKRKFPDADIFFICGTDSFLTMETWYKGSDILKNFSLIVSARPGYKEEEFHKTLAYYEERYGTVTVTLGAKMPDVSSTEVRRRILSGMPITGLVPEAVERYIADNGLYKKDN